MNNKTIIGKEEWCSLPGLSLPTIKAKVDSGATTSSLHAFNIHAYTKEKVNYVSFDIHPIQKNRELVQHCTALLFDIRYVKSSSGEKEKRHVIQTEISIGGDSWVIQITLTNRDSMGYRMLLGREAIKEHILIDPNTSFCLGEIESSVAEGHYSKSKNQGNKLKIALLASNPNLYSNQRLMEAAEERGHQIKFINIQQCFMNISHINPEIHYRGSEILNYFDAVIPRIKPAMTFYGCAVTSYFQFLNAICLNSSIAISNSRDKLRSLQLLSNHGLPMPATGFANSPSDTKDIIKMVGGAPLIIKLLEGAQGKGVVLAETNKAAESVVNAFKSLKANILVQEFIKESLGRDIRCFVIDNKVVGSMERIAAEGEFRANIHLGGTAAPVKITSEERKIAIRATKILGLDVAGVDLIRSNTGTKILEINSSPGLEGIENVTDKDIAGLMIQCIEEKVKEKIKKTTNNE